MARTSPQQLSDAEWLKRAETQAVMGALAAAGFPARVVGGAVRNALIGAPVTDIDIATPARPDEVIAAARRAGLEAIPTGIAHGTVTVVAGGRPYEVTTLRKDVETHGRHATVAFTDDWSADASRRDFTINALYCDADGTVLDPLGGHDDLLARRVRFIGDPGERIREDYLRILRFFRMAAMFGEGPLDRDALSACVRERAGLSILSPERVRQELMRLLGAPRGPEIVRAMFDHGLIVPVLGGAPRPGLLDRLAAIEGALGAAPDAALRLGTLAVVVQEDADRLKDRLRLSNDEAAVLVDAAGVAPGADHGMSDRRARALLYTHGADGYRRHVLLSWAYSGDAPDDAGWRARVTLPDRWQPPRLALGGSDVIALGVPAGPRVGDLLRALEAWWIDGDFAADASAQRAKLEELVSAGREAE